MSSGSPIEDRLRQHYRGQSPDQLSESLAQRILSQTVYSASKKSSAVGPIILALALVIIGLGVGISLHQFTGVAKHGTTPKPTPSATAQPTSAAPLGAPIERFVMESLTAGWASTSNAVLHTNNGARQWADVTPPWASALRVAAFIDASHAWLAGSSHQDGGYTGSVVLGWTSNSGTSWQEAATISPAAPGLPVDLTFTDPAHGWLLWSFGSASGSEGYSLFRTTDGGRSWSQISYATFQNGISHGALPLGCHKSGVSFVNAETGWATGYCNQPGAFFFVTHDGGVTWAPQTIPTSGVQFGEGAGIPAPPTFYSQSTGVMLAQPHSNGSLQNVIYTTTDSGTTWSAHPLPSLSSNGQPDIFGMLDSQNWYLLSADGSILKRTSDSGGHWVSLPTRGLTTAPGIVDFVTTKIGFVVGFGIGQSEANSLSLLNETNDGGATWKGVAITMIR